MRLDGTSCEIGTSSLLVLPTGKQPRSFDGPKPVGVYHRNNTLQYDACMKPDIFSGKIELFLSAFLCTQIESQTQIKTPNNCSNTQFNRQANNKSILPNQPQQP